MSDPASVKKSLSAQFSVDVPPPLEHTDPETLAALLQSTTAEAPPAVIVIDVRLAEEFEKGHIAGAWNYPHSDVNIDELVTRVEDAAAKQLPSALHVVFASLQSPDLDEAVAQDFIEAWDARQKQKKQSETGNTAAAADNNATAFVSLLLGGIFYWLRLYHSQPALTLKYDAATWDDIVTKYNQESSL
jgi:rhodanese-related sulfurtransferase